MTWSTGYETGSLFLSPEGRHLGINRRSDTGLGTDAYDEAAVSDCVALAPK